MARPAGVAELVDALDSGSSELSLWGFKSPLPHFIIRKTHEIRAVFFSFYDPLTEYGNEMRAYEHCHSCREKACISRAKNDDVWSLPSCEICTLF